MMASASTYRSRACFLCAGLMWASSAWSGTTDAGKAERNQGLTIENIGRGLKSAAKNIESEVPKIGPAIGDTFKKITGSDKEKKQSQPHSNKPKDTPKN